MSRIYSEGAPYPHLYLLLGFLHAAAKEDAAKEELSHPRWITPLCLFLHASTTLPLQQVRRRTMSFSLFFR